MNVIRFLTLCAVVGSFVLVAGTLELPQKPQQALAAAAGAGAAVTTGTGAAEGGVSGGAKVIGWPFGGKVLVSIPCFIGTSPPYAFLLTVRPTGPFYIPFLMWTPATVGFLYNLKAPPIPLQWIIGRAQGFLPCIAGIAKIGGGPIITFYGSSIPSPK